MKIKNIWNHQLVIRIPYIFVIFVAILWVWLPSRRCRPQPITPHCSRLFVAQGSQQTARTAGWDASLNGDRYHWVNQLLNYQLLRGKSCFHRFFGFICLYGGNLEESWRNPFILSSSWWLNQPIWNILLQSNWIIFPNCQKFSTLRISDWTLQTFEGWMNLFDKWRVLGSVRILREPTNNLKEAVEPQGICINLGYVLKLETLPKMYLQDRKISSKIYCLLCRQVPKVTNPLTSLGCLGTSPGW